MVFCAFLVVTPLFAQNSGIASAEHDKGWLALGWGSGFHYDVSGIINANLGRKNIVQLAYNFNSDYLPSNNSTLFSEAFIVLLLFWNFSHEVYPARGV